MRDKAEVAWAAALDVLLERNGFDDWWVNLDEDVAEELERSVIDAIEEDLTEMVFEP